MSEIAPESIIAFIDYECYRLSTLKTKKARDRSLYKIWGALQELEKIVSKK